MRLLLVEDDPALRAQLRTALVEAGYVVDEAADGREALHLGDTEPFDAVLLDLGLPGLDGLSVLRRWREAGRTMPVLVLTARDRWHEKVAGIDAGADDYLAKPFDLDELEARVRALARRGGAGADDRAPEAFCGLQLDRASGAVHWHDTVLELPPRELAFLRALLARPGHAVAKEVLFEQVFPGDHSVQLEAIEVVAYRLRKKLMPTGAQLVTLRGLGYLLKAAA